MASKSKPEGKTAPVKKGKSNVPVYLGVLLLAFSVCVFLACVSYFFTWKQDQDLLSLSFSDLMLDSTHASQNLWGKVGAYISHHFIYNGFGVISILLAGVFFVISFKLIANKWLVKPLPLLKRSLFIVIWVSIFLGLIVPDSSLWLSGVYGYQISTVLVNLVGKTGVIIFLLLALGLFLNISFAVSFAWILSAFSFSGLKKKIKTDEIFNDSAADIIIPRNKEEEEQMLDSTKKILEDTNKTVDFSEPKPEPQVVSPLDVDFEPVVNKETTKSKKPNPNPPDDEFEIEIAQSDTDIKAIEDSLKEEEEVALDVTEIKPEKQKSSVKEVQDGPVLDPYDPTLDLGNFKMPDLPLLRDFSNDDLKLDREVLRAELEENKNKIVSTLNDYKIEISKIKATIGPTVTLYEIVPAPGVRISKIKSLEDDIALSLSALGIRIIAPIPGRGTIGIEVPNQSSEIVGMKAVLGSEKFLKSKMELPIGLGKTISNETYVADLAKMPHLLMAGATGQGKSVGLNAILVSLLYKKHPSQIKFVLVDPKKVELTLFNKLERHYLAKLPDSAEAIITDTKKVVTTLNSLCMEMDQRYDLLKTAMVRNIKEYNAKFIARKLNPEKGHKYLPYIVLVVDEFADLIMTAGKEVETPIARLAQLARAIGIHLIIATQRPSVNIITGIIKANFPSRIAFRVTSKVDSRTILDAGGADQLIGRGDMLLSLGSDLIRLQCAFVDTPEVEAICDFIGEQRGYPDAFLLPEFSDDTSGGNQESSLEDLDALFEDAARMVVMSQQGSASMLQRKLKLGYNRAGRLIDQLESAGIVGPSEGSKARQVLFPDEYSLEQYLNQMNDK